MCSCILGIPQGTPTLVGASTAASAPSDAAATAAQAPTQDAAAAAAQASTQIEQSDDSPQKKKRRVQEDIHVSSTDSGSESDSSEQSAAPRIATPEPAQGPASATGASAAANGAKGIIAVGDHVVVHMRSKVYNGRTGILRRILSRSYVVVLDSDKEERKFGKGNVKKLAKTAPAAAASSSVDASGEPSAKAKATAGLEMIFGKLGV